MKHFRILTSKINFLILILFFSCISVYAQDIITLRSGARIEAKVTEITTTELRYKRFEQLNGPTRVFPLADVFAVNYEDGTREVFNAEKRRETAQPIDNHTKPKIERTQTIYDDSTKYFASLKLGFGGNTLDGNNINKYKNVIGLDFAYFFNKKLGTGLVFRRFYFIDDTTRVAKSRYFFGPALYGHFNKHNSKLFFPAIASIGFAQHYKPHYTYYYSDEKVNTIGCFLSLGVAYRPIKSLSVGLNTEIVGAKFISWDVSLGVNFHF